MKIFRLSAAFLCMCVLFLLVACQPVTRIPESPVLVEHNIPTFQAHAGGIKVGADGALWFAETGANQIGRIATDGTVTEYPVPTEDAIDDRQGFVGLGPDGAIWFNEDLVNKLGRITPDGAITEFDLPEGSGGVREMVASPDGNLWVTATFVNKIYKLSTDGELLAEYTMPTAESRPAGMVLGPDNAFWFTEAGANQIGRISLDGEVTEYALPEENSFPIRITLGPDGALWFGLRNAHKVGRISTDGEITTFEAGMGPVGIAAGSDGALWFTGYDTTAVGRLTTDGVLTQVEVPTYASIPYHIVAGPDGNLWFTEQQGNKIGQIILPAAKAATQALTTFSPQRFKLPMSLAHGSEWQVTEDYPDVVTLAMQPNLVDTGFITVKGARIAGATAPFSTTPFPEDFTTWIEAHGLFQVVATQPVTVGGFPGTQTDAIGAAACGHRRNWIFPSTGTGWNCTEGQYFRFSYFPDVYGESLLILNTGARTDEKAAEDFKLGTEASQRVLDTIVFAGPP